MSAGASKSIDHLIEPIDAAFEPVTAHDIHQIEQLIGAPLPSSYASFLKRIGSCMFSGHATVRAPNGEALPIGTFFGGKSRSLLADLQSHDYVAQQLVPIADTFFNDRYVLELATGKVHYIEYWTWAEPKRIIEVADSFDHFLTKISVEPYDDAL